jgi:hypothetical protein
MSWMSPQIMLTAVGLIVAAIVSPEIKKRFFDAAQRPTNHLFPPGSLGCHGLFSGGTNGEILKLLAGFKSG